MQTLPPLSNVFSIAQLQQANIASPDDALLHLAFENSLQANIITTVKDGKVIISNKAASKLLGYTSAEMLTKTRADIFEVNESSFKKMLRQRTALNGSKAMVTAIKKNGRRFICEINSAVFKDLDGIKKAIWTIADQTGHIRKQHQLDTKKEQLVADNILQVQAVQKKTDARRKKTVADNIALAASQQKIIDAAKEKLVSENIVLAKIKQKKIDQRNAKTVADNIQLALEKSEARLAANDEWIKYIAKTSYDVMWDWNVSTGEIYVGDSIEEVFGYRLPLNMTSFTDLANCFLPAEKELVEKRLSRTLVSRKKSWSDSFLFKRSDGSVASTTSRASIVRDAKGKAIRLIGATQDVSKLQELEKKLGERNSHYENNGLLRSARLSRDLVWELDLKTGELQIDQAFEEVYGHSLAGGKLSLAEKTGYLHPDDRESFTRFLLEAVESNAVHWKHSYRIIRANGSIAKVLDRGSIIRRADGKAYRIIGAMKDTGVEQELEDLRREAFTQNQLAEYKKVFSMIFNNSSDPFFDVDLVTNAITISGAYEKEFGYPVTGDMTTGKNWLRHICPADRSAFMRNYKRMLASAVTEWQHNYRFLKANNSVTHVCTRAIILRNDTGRAYRIMGYISDIDKQTVLEEKTEQEIKLKELQIAQAVEDSKDAERANIGKELHDNINQLLGASRLYLDMAKRGGDNTEMYLGRSSEYILTAIDEIRKLSKGLTSDSIKNQGLCNTLQNITTDLMEISPVKIILQCKELEENLLSDPFKLNLFRIIQEQLNNILKHAGATTVTITLSTEKTGLVLTISDDGVGFDMGIKKAGIGLDNIKGRVAAFNGVINLVSKPGKGCMLSARFDLAGKMLKNQ